MSLHSQDVSTVPLRRLFGQKYDIVRFDAM